MAFVNEFVPEDQKKLLKADARFNKSWGAIDLRKWTIDRERNVFIVYVQGGMPSLGDEYVDPDHYAMCWNGEVIKFTAATRSSSKYNEGRVVDWVVHKVGIPPSLELQRDSVLQLIQEGLDAMGTVICDRDGIAAVNVHFK